MVFHLCFNNVSANRNTAYSLTEYQSEWIFENILGPSVVPWMNDNSDNNVLQIFMAGDFNVGELLNPQNLDIWYENGWVNARDIEGIVSVDEGGTFNADENSELPNVLARQGSIDGGWVLTDRDLGLCVPV